MNGASTNEANLTLEAIAYHEAGHVIAHIVLKIPIESATIRPSLGSLGAVMLSKEKKNRKVLRDEKEVVCDLAGPVCQCMFSRHPYFWESEGRTCTYPEISEVLDILQGSCPSEEESLQRFAYYLYWTERLLIRYSSRVHLIAAALIDNEDLTFKQVEWLFAHSAQKTSSPKSRLSRNPSIVLSGIRGSCESGGFYSPRDNKILLTDGLRFAGEDEAEYYIQTLSHELAHWASFLFLSPVERAWVIRKYDALRALCEGDASRESVEERFAEYASGVR